MDAAEQCLDLESTSFYLGFAPQHIFYLVQNANDMYFECSLPKRSSPDERRIINIPISELKGVQKVILARILENIEPNSSAFAYIKGKSVVSAARNLCGKSKSVLKIDLRNFFPSINERRVFGLFRSIGFNSKVSYIFTKLTTYNGALCQGAPTSPAISNLICRKLDETLTALSRKWELQYIRYSDDIFLYKTGNFNYRQLIETCTTILQEHSFELNRNKSKYMPAGKPRFTLGLTTHGRHPQIPKKTRRHYRAAFYKASTNLSWATEHLPQLSGMAEWHKSVYGSDETYHNYRRTIQNVQNLRLHDTYIVR